MTDRETVVEEARSLASQGYLCSEAVLLAVSSWLGVHSELIPRIATGFGAGVGGCGSVCGALSGGIMALGLRLGRNDSRREEGRRPYWFSKELFERFEAEFGSEMCRDITGCDIRTDEGRKKYSDEKTWETKCRRFVSSVAAAVYDIVSEQSQPALEPKD